MLVLGLGLALRPTDGGIGLGLRGPVLGLRGLGLDTSVVLELLVSCLECKLS